MSNYQLLLTFKIILAGYKMSPHGFEERKGDKAYFTIECGRGAGERMTTGIFIYTRPKDQIQKNHNAEALRLVDVKKSELLLERQAIGTEFVPAHKFKPNFLDYYEEFVRTISEKQSVTWKTA